LENFFFIAGWGGKKIWIPPGFFFFFNFWIPPEKKVKKFNPAIRPPPPWGRSKRPLGICPRARGAIGPAKGGQKKFVRPLGGAPTQKKKNPAAGAVGPKNFEPGFWGVPPLPAFFWLNRRAKSQYYLRFFQGKNPPCPFFFWPRNGCPQTFF